MGQEIKIVLLTLHLEVKQFSSRNSKGLVITSNSADLFSITNLRTITFIASLLKPNPCRAPFK